MIQLVLILKFASMIHVLLKLMLLNLYNVQHHVLKIKFVGENVLP